MRSGALFVLMVVLATASIRFSIGGGVDGSVVDRVTTYYKNLFSGVEMETREWLYADEMVLRQLDAFGGLADAARSSSADAARRGGLKSIIVDPVGSDHDTAEVKVTLVFGNGQKEAQKEKWHLDGGLWKRMQ